MKINQKLILTISGLTILSLFLLCTSFLLLLENKISADRELSAQNALSYGKQFMIDSIEELDILTEKVQVYSKNDYNLLNDLKKYSTQDYSQEDLYFTSREIRSIFQTLSYRQDNINFMSIILKNGEIITYSNSQQDFYFNYNPIESDWYQNTLKQAGSLYISTIETDGVIINATEEKAILYSRNIYDFSSKQLLGTLIVNYQQDYLNEMISTVEKNISSITLQDSLSRSILYHSKRNDSDYVQTFSTTLNKVTQPLNLSLELDYTEIEVVRRNLFEKTILLSLITVLLSSLLTIVFSNQFTKPIQKLSYLMSHRSDFKSIDQNTSYKKTDEITTLYNEFYLMLANLKKHTDEKIKYEKQFHHLTELVYKNQIDSHFLYNSLESINSIAEVEELDDIALIATSLSKMFRYTANGFLTETTVQEELQHVKDYLAIQQLRFQKEFPLIIQTEDKLLKATIPKIILQPIVENAIYHGFDKGSYENPQIIITVTRQANFLYITLKDNGKGIPLKSLLSLQEKLKDPFDYLNKQNNHIALANIQARIQNLYGQKYGLSLKKQDGLIITLMLPYQLKENT